MRGDGEILLVSTYELGHAPHGIALPKAFLERAGFRPAALDLAIEPLDPARVLAARLVALSVPMHTALRLGVEAARRVRALNPGCALAFHGLYATLNAGLLEREGAAAVLSGECEEDLVALAVALERGEPTQAFLRRGGAGATRTRLEFPSPSRSGQPSLDRYARLDDGRGAHLTAGYTEATRGCLHRCRHCPIPALYGGRFFAVPVERVLDDVAQQVAAGARHVTFGDPDFLNGPGHALRVARAVRERFPTLTFDFTAKVEHLVRYAETVEELGRLGAIFATTAVESLSERVLERLEKGHRRADVDAAFGVAARAGISLRPTLVPFTPWETLEGYVDLLETFAARGWLPDVDPVQLTLRLLVPPGSLLEGAPDVAFEGLDERALTWRWRHPDPRMDALQREVAAAAAEGEHRRELPHETQDRILALAAVAAGRALGPAVPTPHSGRRGPRLTEHWFC
ncbi:MAG TPA: CUAEP/CCAEP-tail radical SAM protein [Anaeromyxobacteraceae bacterium]|nr:CUAEP/CCAEP-tail radical SAM protein [Anaeromyxobacteraceae bacterium]